MRDLRLAKGMTQAEVAKSLGLKHSQHVAAFESGRATFPAKRARAFCQLMGVGEKDFLRLALEDHELRLSEELSAA